MNTILVSIQSDNIYKESFERLTITYSCTFAEAGSAVDLRYSSGCQRRPRS